MSILKITRIDRNTWRDDDGLFIIRQNPETKKKVLEMSMPNTFPLLEDLARVDAYFETNSISKASDVDGGDQDKL